MEELKLMVPTYVGDCEQHNAEETDNPDFGQPFLPVLIHESDGIRVIMGSHDRVNSKVPDVLIERRPKGWVIFLHPIGGSDPSGMIFFCDDGRSYVVKETYGATPAIEERDYEHASSVVDRP